ncbi:AAA domain-containing protein [Actinoplanes sp. HUAS TT8]|uniref:AAA domain-containing protein n=1 Tax=Actinoplanes sp. HUAS TT8 TaxID=3447453 RepID=UPI003F528D85
MASMPVDLDRRVRNTPTADAERLGAALAGTIRAGGAGEREQREAVLRLRSGMGANPGLLAWLSGAESVREIDLLFEAEGAGRARAVAEVARCAADRGERVLIAAPSRAAADAAVACLPGELTVIRLEEPGAGPCTLAGVAAELRERALAEAGEAGDPLLADWRERMARPPAQLYGELLRNADVIAATWLGCGRPEFADLEYDLVVVDGADRMPRPVALVPLVRARRAVLIGRRGGPARG